MIPDTCGRITILFQDIWPDEYFIVWIYFKCEFLRIFIHFSTIFACRFQPEVEKQGMDGASLFFRYCSLWKCLRCSLYTLHHPLISALAILLTNGGRGDIYCTNTCAWLLMQANLNQVFQYYGKFHSKRLY